MSYEINTIPIIAKLERQTNRQTVSVLTAYETPLRQKEHSLDTAKVGRESFLIAFCIGASAQPCVRIECVGERERL